MYGDFVPKILFFLAEPLSWSTPTNLAKEALALIACSQREPPVLGFVGFVPYLALELARLRDAKV